MNWDQIEGRWEQMKGGVKSEWGKLTDDDLTEIRGDRQKMLGKIQERYGMAKEEAERSLDDWTSKHQGVL